MGTIAAIILYRKCGQLEAYLKFHLNIHQLHDKESSFFLKETVLALVYLDNFNAIYGIVLFAYILINMPINALLLMMLFVNGKLSFTVQLVFVLMCITQILFLLAISYACALLSLKFHRPAKILLGSVAKPKNWSQQSLLTQLKLLRYLEHFHTLKLHTVNYGNGHSQITMQNFGRHLFFYVRLMLFAFKLVKQ